MDIQELIRTRDDLDERIGAQVARFLDKLDAAGEFAPTVTRRYAGGHDLIQNVCLDAAGNVVLACTNAYRGNVDHYTVSYPAALVDDPDDAAIQAYAAGLRADRQKAAADKAAAEAARRRENELATLAELQAKYKNAPLPLPADRQARIDRALDDDGDGFISAGRP